MKLRGRAEAPDQSRGCTLSSSTRGDTTEHHGPLQRLLEAMLPVRLATVSNHGNINQQACIIDRVDDAPVANANTPEVISALELSAAAGARVARQRFDALKNALRYDAVKRLQLLTSRARKDDRVLTHGAGVWPSAAASA